MNYKDSQLLYTVLGGVLQSENVVGFSHLLLEKLENYFNEVQLDYEDVGSTRIFLLSQFGEDGDDGQILLRDRKSKEKFDEAFKYFMELEVDHGDLNLNDDEWKEFTEVCGLPQDILDGIKPLMVEATKEEPKAEEEVKTNLILKEERKPRKSTKKKTN